MRCLSIILLFTSVSFNNSYGFYKRIQDQELNKVSPTQASRIINLAANVVDGKITLSWDVSESDSIVSFQIMRSLDGFNFYSLTTKKVSSFLRGDLGYKFVDEQATVLSVPHLYYQVHAVLAKGKAIQSAPVEIANHLKQNFQFFVTPYPGERLFFVHYLLKDKKSDYELKVVDGLGNTMYSRMLEINSEGESFPIATQDWEDGPFYIQAISKDIIITHKHWVGHKRGLN